MERSGSGIEENGLTVADHTGNFLGKGVFAGVKGIVGLPCKGGLSPMGNDGTALHPYQLAIPFQCGQIVANGDRSGTQIGS